MFKHHKYEFIKDLIENDISTMLIGPSGCGKSTIAIQAIKELNMEMSAMVFTKQTSINSILGFISVNGTYISSQFREAFEHGKVFLAEEYNGADSNVLLTFNTIENGYMAFPDKIVHVHPNFRFVATSNPEDKIYTGRSTLDFATIDRFFKVRLDRDEDLELNLTSPNVISQVTMARTFLKSQGSSIQVTMRDSLRIHKLGKLKLIKDPLLEVVFYSDPNLGEIYLKEIDHLKEEQKRKEEEERENNKSQQEMTNYQDYITKIKKGL